MGDGGGRAMAGSRQGVPQGADDKAAHKTRITESNLRLRWMNVHVDEPRVELEVEGRGGMSVAGEKIGVGAPKRALQETILHRTTVDEKMLVSPGAARVGG